MSDFLWLLGYRQGANAYCWKWHESYGTPIDVKLSTKDLPEWKRESIKELKESCDYYIVRDFSSEAIAENLRRIRNGETL